MAHALQEAVEHDEGGDVGRGGEMGVAATDDEAEDDVAGPADDAGPATPDAVAEVHADQRTGDDDGGQDQLPDADG